MIEAVDLCGAGIDLEKVKGTARAVMGGEKKEGDISIALVSKKRMKQINYQYRGKDEATDVLSFSLGNTEEGIMGQIIVCPEVIKEREGEQEVLREVGRRVAHGLLHILGYNHNSEGARQKMEKKEADYLRKVTF